MGEILEEGVSVSFSAGAGFTFILGVVVKIFDINLFVMDLFTALLTLSFKVAFSFFKVASLSSSSLRMSYL